MGGWDLTGPIRFALNHMAAPGLDVDGFFSLAAELGLEAVEIRNDLPGTAIADGTPPEAVRDAAARRGVSIISINALQRFNDWSDARAEEARALAAYAAACGAEALVLCPVNDKNFPPRQADRLRGLSTALSSLAPVLADHGLTGLVEPLGFAESSLRLKREAVEAIDEVGAPEFRLVHDTFHHAIAGEEEIFPNRTGLVHVSGVEDPSLPLSSLRDSHRALVGPRDRLGNAGQLRRLREGGYDGYVSFEPFAESVHALADVRSALAESMAVLDPDRRSQAA
jgi:2-keto-myo-inositol isomerase